MRNLWYGIEKSRFWNLEVELWRKYQSCGTIEEGTEKRVTKYIKMFIGASCDIGFLCSNMPVEAKKEIYDMESKNQDFET